MRSLLLALALLCCCAGCAANNVGGGADVRLASEVALSKAGASKSVTAAPADSSGWEWESPLWNGKNVPAWACSLGHYSRDSAATVAGVDSLLHLKVRVSVVSADFDSLYSAGDHAAVWGASLAPAEQAAPATFRQITDLRAGTASEQAAAVTLTWTMPRLASNGDTLSTRPLRWRLAYSTQSKAFINHRWQIVNNPDSATFWWPTVVSEAAPLVVANGYGIPGEHMAIAPPPVWAWDWPFTWWVATRQDSSDWSWWSNPVGRWNNE